MEDRYGENDEWYIYADTKTSQFYHIHEGESFPNKGYFYVTKDGICRQCGDQAPKGIRFMAATARLKKCL